ncbi:hypothetical protein [Daejeonella lutea]|uniref:hypothetical protein n=1 Tax=Daejeonella lutea TaxID=572036 RepID=UPI001482C6B1|nr:hypothetical protein [Daejeonella lutea]
MAQRIVLGHPGGNLYRTAGGKLFKFNPDTIKLDILDEKASKSTIDGQGKLYFSRGTHLWQYIAGK